MALTLQIASDLHLEHIPTGDRATFDLSSILTPSADVLALAGDIGSPFDGSLEAILSWSASRWKRVYFVHGNHELYSNSGIAASDIIAAMQQLCEKYQNVVYLNNRVDVFEGVCFIGSTLWSEVPEAYIEPVTNHLNDYIFICTRPGVPSTVNDTNAEFHKNKEFLRNAISNALEKSYWPIIITHHAPWTKKTSNPRFDGQVTNCAFATDIPASNNEIQLWVSGHTHYNYSHTLAGYKLVSNQKGYGNGDKAVRGYKKDYVCNVVAQLSSL